MGYFTKNLVKRAANNRFWGASGEIEVKLTFSKSKKAGVLQKWLKLKNINKSGREATTV